MPMPLPKKFSLFLFATIVLAFGCAEMLGALDKLPKTQLGEDMRQQRVKMEADYRQNDGYEDTNGVPSYSLHQAVKGKKAKFCVQPVDFLDETFKPGPVQVEDRKAFDKLRGAGKAPSDRYYVVHGHAFLSVPKSEMEELRQNMKENEICGWTDGNTEEAAGKAHVPLAKWDGILRAQARHANDPPPAAPASSQAAAP
jgi:hypothetical protein